MSSASDLLKIARSQLGVKEYPPGSNRVKYTTWYPMIGPWCAMFVSWCAEKAGIPTSVIPKHAYTPSGRNWFRSRGQWGSTPKVGAIAYYNLSGLGRVSHVGIVEKVFSDGSFNAIEGNTDSAGGRTGGRVMRKRRKYMGAGGGFGYPKYNGKSTNPKTPSGGNTSTFESGKAKHAVGSRIMRMYNGGTDVKWLQKRLSKVGFSAGTVDGQFGKDTLAAVKAFQKAHKLTVDGEVGPKTIAALKAAKETGKAPKKPAKKSDPFPLPKGHFYYTEDSRSTVHSGYWKKDRPAIRKIQKKVGTGVDGGYGKKTKAAVMRWQKKHGLKADGAVGANTWAKMF